MERRALGASGVEVSAIAPGCWGMSGSYGPADEAESVATLHHALDLGVDFIDTADSYGGGGPREAATGGGMGKRRPGSVLGTKNRLGQGTGAGGGGGHR